jgi:type IV secretory pathway VirB2 component (pilin)
MNSLLRRLGGLGLVVLSLGPMIAVIAGIVLVGALCVDAVRSAGEKIAGVATIVSGEILPQVHKVQASYATLAAQAEQMKAEIDKAMLVVAKIEDLRIQSGQLGAIPSVHIHIPEREVSFADGAVKIKDGELFNQTIPGVQMPPESIAMPMAPLRAAFAPFGPDGPVGQALGSSQRELEATFGEVTKLQQPLQDIETTVLDGLAPLQADIAKIAVIGLLTFAALGLLLAIYIVTGILLVIGRPHEAGAVYRTGGTLGFMGFVSRTLLSQGTSRLLGRTPPPSPEAATAELEQTVIRLETQLAALRAELTGGHAPAAT